MVPHHPQVVLGHRHRAHRRVTAGRRARVQVGLVQRHAVDLDRAALPALDGVAADRDHPLDEVLLVVGGQQADRAERRTDPLDERVALDPGHRVQPAARVLEDHHLTALRLGAEPRGELVDQDPVVLLQRVLHRTGGDGEGLDEEGLDAQ